MVRNYFAYMFGKYTDQKWFEYIREPVDETLLPRFASMDRHMWCTGGFLHAAGYTVSRDGKIVPIEQARDSSVFTFDTIRVTCSDDSITRWRRDDTSKKRFMFHVRDTDNYQSAMTRAMRSLLTALP
jgi:hypothetical protein